MKKGCYADVIRTTMRKGDKDGMRITLRDLEKATEFSYEHLRKVCAGEPVVSEECNADICRVLKLDEAEMWALAKAEKFQRKNPEVHPSVLVPQDATLRACWSDLTRAQKQQILDIAKGMATQNRALKQLAS
jgi:hypothetical protein